LALSEVGVIGQQAQGFELSFVGHTDGFSCQGGPCHPMQLACHGQKDNLGKRFIIE